MSQTNCKLENSPILNWASFLENSQVSLVNKFYQVLTKKKREKILKSEFFFFKNLTVTRETDKISFNESPFFSPLPLPTSR